MLKSIIETDTIEIDGVSFIDISALKISEHKFGEVMSICNTTTYINTAMRLCNSAGNSTDVISEDLHNIIGHPKVCTVSQHHSRVQNMQL